jgi:hypothetical protein
LTAVVLGLGLGVLLSRGTGAVLPASSDVLPAVTLPPVEAAPPLTLPADLPPPSPIPTPRTTVFFLPPRTTAPAAPEPTAPAPATTAPETATPAGPTLTVEPSSGPADATLQVSGTRWEPGSRVLLEYLDPAGRPTGSRATVTVEADGTFEGELVARDPSGLPGRHSVRASDGTRTRTAPYDVTA